MNIINKATGWVLIAVMATSCTVFRQKDSSHYSASGSLVLQAGRLDSHEFVLGVRFNNLKRYRSLKERLFPCSIQNLKKRDST